jgi:hypothetical protein
MHIYTAILHAPFEIIAIDHVETTIAICTNSSGHSRIHSGKQVECLEEAAPEYEFSESCNEVSYVYSQVKTTVFQSNTKIET